MIKVETLGMLDVAKTNSVLKSSTDVTNYSFITDDNDLYLIENTVVGDNSYIDNAVIAAGECLNGYLVKAWEGQKLVADEKHIKYSGGKAYKDITAGTTMLKVGADGKLEITQTAPTSGVYFKVTDKCKLTENAVKMKVIVVDEKSAT